MSRTFTKLFSSITESTVWCEPDRTRLVWIAMLAMADMHGRVWASIPGLANRARVPFEDAQIAINTFLSPDPFSRTPDHEGRRVEVIDGGWRLLNHAKYRAIRDEESTKESKRNYINKRRAAERVEKSRTESNSVDAGRDNAEADTEADTEAKADAKAIPGVPPRPPSATRSPAPARAKRDPAPSAATWEAYETAYELRYQAKPVRNRKVNAQLAQVVERLGAEHAPAVAGYYLTHQNRLYVNAMHCVDLLLRDCEKLHTEWTTGRQTTQAGATLADRTMTNMNAFAPLLAAARAGSAK